METLAFAIGRHLADRAGEEFNERDMRERFQRHFRADKRQTPKKTKKKRPSKGTDDSTDSDTDDSSGGTQFPPRKSSGDDDNPPAGGGSGRGRGRGTRQTPTGGRPPARSQSRSASRSGGRNQGSGHKDTDDLPMTFCLGVAFYQDDWDIHLPIMFARGLTLEDGDANTDVMDLPLTFCAGVTFHDENIGPELPRSDEISGEDPDDICPCDSVSQRPSISASSDESGPLDLPDLPVTSEETDTEIVDMKLWLDDAERPVSDRALETCYLDDPRHCSAPIVSDSAKPTNLGAGGDTPMKGKQKCGEDDNPQQC